MALLEIDEGSWEAHAGRAPFLVRHRLVEEPLLSHEAVVALAGRLPHEDVETNVRDLPTVMDTDDVPPLDRAPAELARDIEELGRWLALSYIEQVPAYREVVDRCLDDAGPAVNGWQGGMTVREGYIFLSAANSVTPAHVDHEHNLLLQIHGTKRVTIGSFNGDDEEQRALESMHSGGYGRTRQLPQGAQVFTMAPGDGVYIPPCAVHMIENLGSTSISLSLVWHTPVLERSSRVYTVNAKLRRLGLDPLPPGRSVLRDRLKAGTLTTVQALRRVKAKV